jgi:palmitoyltransferase
VRRFDHHCAWIGNCIGEGNHRLLFAYLTSQLALLVWASIQVLSAFEDSGDAQIWFLHQLHLLFAMLVRHVLLWYCICVLHLHFGKM